MTIGERTGVFGAITGAAAMAALGLVELARGEALPGLHPYSDDWPAGVIRASGALLLLFAASALRWPRVTGLALAMHWLVAAAFVTLRHDSERGRSARLCPLGADGRVHRFRCVALAQAASARGDAHRIRRHVAALRRHPCDARRRYRWSHSGLTFPELRCGRGSRAACKSSRGLPVLSAEDTRSRRSSSR